MNWIKEYALPTTCMLASAWLAAYAGFNLGVEARANNQTISTPPAAMAIAPEAAFVDPQL